MSSRPAAAGARPTQRLVAIGMLCCVVSAVAYGFLGLFGVHVRAAGASLQTMIGWRFALAAVGLWGIVVLLRRRRPGRRAVGQALIMGAVIYSLQTSLYFVAVDTLSVGLAALLLYTMPAIVVVVELVRRTERPRASLIVAVVLAIGGVGITMLGPESAATSLLGVLCGLGSALAYTGYYYAMVTLPSGTDPLTASALVCTGAAASQLVLGGLLGTFDPTPGWTALAWLVPMALLCTVVAVSLLMIGIALAGPAVSSVVSCMEPITSVLLGVLLLSEGFGLPQLLGGAAVVAAIVVLGLRREKPEVGMEHG